MHLAGTLEGDEHDVIAGEREIARPVATQQSPRLESQFTGRFVKVKYDKRILAAI